jgi:hypothetical protein
LGIAYDPQTGRVYASTDYGVVVREAGGTTWGVAGMALPPVAAETGTKARPAIDQVIAATTVQPTKAACAAAERLNVAISVSSIKRAPWPAARWSGRRESNPRHQLGKLG